MDLGTTTYAGRHSKLFKDAAELVVGPGGRPLQILEIGPGLSVRWLGRVSGKPAFIRIILKGVETVVRRLPLPDSCFENYESEEILTAFGRQRSELSLMDVNPRPLRVIGQNPKIPVAAKLTADLTALQLEPGHPQFEAFDVVVALTTLARIPVDKRARAAENIAAMTRRGGWVLADGNAITREPSLQPTDVGNLSQKI